MNNPSASLSSSLLPNDGGGGDGRIDDNDCRTLLRTQPRRVASRAGWDFDLRRLSSSSSMSIGRMEEGGWQLDDRLFVVNVGDGNGGGKSQMNPVLILTNLGPPTSSLAADDLPTLSTPHAEGSTRRRVQASRAKLGLGPALLVIVSVDVNNAQKD